MKIIQDKSTGLNLGSDSMISDYKFPSEINLHIFSFLDVKDLINCSFVSKEWNILSNDDCLWMNFLEGCDFNPEAGFKSFLARHSVKSAHELVERIKVFVNSIEINQTGYFTCRFPGSSQPFASFKLGTCIKKPSLDPEEDLVMNLFLLKRHSIDFADLTNVKDSHGKKESILPIIGYVQTKKITYKLFLPTDKESEVYRIISQISDIISNAYSALEVIAV